MINSKGAMTIGMGAAVRRGCLEKQHVKHMRSRRDHNNQHVDSYDRLGVMAKDKTYPNEAPGLCDWPCSAPGPCAFPGCAHPRCPGSISANRKRCLLGQAIDHRRSENVREAFYVGQIGIHDKFFSQPQGLRVDGWKATFPADGGDSRQTRVYSDITVAGVVQ